MLKAILFDMDGTLIENSMETFLPPYFAALSKKMAHLVAPEKLIAQLRASTQVMMNNRDAAVTLADVFAADFYSKVGVPRAQLEPLFEEFYAREYRDLRAFTRQVEGAEQVMRRAFESQRQVVIATGPFFPRTAIQQRLEWGGLADFPYALVTSYEILHACKPHSAYYREIAAMLNLTPEECLMIGNDVEMDILPARKIGMKTFWITAVGFFPTDVPADWRGTLRDVGELLRDVE